MAGEIRKEQIEGLEIGSEEIEDIDASEVRITNIGEDSLAIELRSRLLTEPSAWSSQKDALDASEGPSEDNPFITFNQMTRQIALGEYSTWRFPMDSVSGLSWLPPENNRDGDCRLIKGIGIYEWNSRSGASGAWAPILESGNIFHSSVERTLSDGESTTVEHEPDPNFTRLVQAFEKMEEGEIEETENKLWRGFLHDEVPHRYGDLTLSADDGPDRAGQGELDRGLSGTAIRDSWYKSYAGLRILFTSEEAGPSTDVPTRTTISSVVDEKSAWVDEASACVSEGAIAEVDANLGASEYQICSAEIYNDIRLVESFHWDSRNRLAETQMSFVNSGLKTVYSKNQKYVFLLYIDATNGGSIVYYNVETGVYSDPIVINADTTDIAGTISSLPSASGDELLFAYIKSDNSVRYNSFRVEGGLDPAAEETVVAADGAFGRDQLKITQGGNLQPVIGVREGQYDLLAYRCRETGGGWTAKGFDDINIRGYNLTSAPGLSVVYVKADATGLNNGTSWRNALVSLTDALKSTVGYSEIWVAAGEYTPLPGWANSFEMREGVYVYGGFAGTETERDQKDWTQNHTILSGQNHYHTVVGADKSLLDGFTIIGGGKDIEEESDPNGYGGGILNDTSSMLVRSCTFGSNKGRGAAIYNKTGTVEIVKCAFSGNSSAYGRGGAIWNGSGGSVDLTNSVLEGNSAKAGGAIFDEDSSTRLYLTHCTLHGNTSSFNEGDAIEVRGPDAKLENTIVWGYGTAADKAIRNEGGSLSLQNCDVVGGIGGIVTVSGGTTTDSGGNINSDPLFYSSSVPGGIDTYFGTADDGFRLKIGSPCVNAGMSVDLDNDLLGTLRPLDGGYDIGAYEGAMVGEDIIFVDSGATTGNDDGTNWENGWLTLTDALSAAGPGDEIWVAEGTYKPTSTSTSITIAADIKVFGGFRGTEVFRDQRGAKAYPTILTIQAGGTKSIFEFSGNGSKIDGFILKDGNAADKGGGVTNDATSSEIVNCTLKDNAAVNLGGAIVGLSGSSLSIVDCDLTGNSSPTTGTGGALCFELGAQGTVSSSIFSQNDAAFGGAIAQLGGAVIITNTVFLGNTAGEAGGGAIYKNTSSDLDLINCTGFNNTSATEDDAGNLYSDGNFAHVESGNLNLTNTIAWQDVPSETLDRHSAVYLVASTEAYVEDCDIYAYGSTTWSDAFDGLGTLNDNGGNISSDPKFLDDTLSNGYDGVDDVSRTADDALMITSDSPCRNTCDSTTGPTTDIRGALRPTTGDETDMGAYEFLAQVPPIVQDPGFGMISESRFAISLANADADVKFREFTWDGANYAIGTDENLSTSNTNLTGDVDSVALSYWCDGSDHRAVLHYIYGDNKVYEGVEDPISGAIQWADNAVAETSATIKSSSSLDKKSVVLLRESYDKAGRYIFHHSRYGWSAKDENGRFLLSPPFSLNSSEIREGLADLSEPALHSPYGVAVSAYVETEDSAVESGVSSSFYKYDNYNLLSPGENDTSGRPLPRSTPMIYQSSAHSLWIYGGKGVATDQGPSATGTLSQLSDVWKFALDSEAWSRLELTGDSATARSGHTLIEREGILYITGGYSEIDSALDPSVYGINPSNGATTLIGELSQGFADSAWIADEEEDLYTFGGMTGTPQNLVASDTVRRIVPSDLLAGYIKSYEISPDQPADQLPALKNAAACVGLDSVGAKVFFLYGGYGSGVVNGNLYQITISGSIYTTEQLSTSGPPRTGASLIYHLTSDGDRLLLVVGGENDSSEYTNSLHIFNLDTSVWTDVSPDLGAAPQEFAYAGVAPYLTLLPALGPKLYVYGGMDSSARRVSPLLFEYLIPDSEDGVFVPDKGNITKTDEGGSLLIRAMDTSVISTIDRIEIPDNGWSRPEGTDIRIAISFSQQLTSAEALLIRRGGAWESITISEIFSEGMSVEEFNAIDATRWAEQFQPGTHKAIFILAGLSTNSNNQTPSLSSLLATYYTNEVYKPAYAETVEIRLSGASNTIIRNVSGDSTPKVFRISLTGERSG